MPYQPVDLVEVRAWGRTVGALAPGGRGTYAFQYADAWVRGGIELAPSLMPLRRQPYTFPGLSEETFQGLPPMIADSLPDRFGNAIVNRWLAEQGIAPERITALDRLAYLGSRGMGALEYVPDRAPHAPTPTALDLGELILAARAAITGSFRDEDASAQTLHRILLVGTSAGGARAKAIVHVDRVTGEVRSGHTEAGGDLEPWLLKFDGVGPDAELGTGAQYGRIEYAYSQMARAAGIEMAETRLLVEHGRAHFMTRRFDRGPAGERLHLQSLCGIDGVDFNLIGVNDYAQLFVRIDGLGLGAETRNQAFRRMAFNVAAANCDDHSKNHAFLYDEAAGWRLSPAFDVTHAHHPASPWTSRHLMAVNGRFDGITRADLLQVADDFQVPGARTAIADVTAAIGSWPEFAAEAELGADVIDRVAQDFVAI
ncbi:MAG TPA: type II toxin-antitoxin system HipA family toxin [Microbacteriaceae bacterium]|nr:type II toxin-antitoxin system HipA family toxin [Microbacteriaceae bacterium]